MTQIHICARVDMRAPSPYVSEAHTCLSQTLLCVRMPCPNTFALDMCICPKYKEMCPRGIGEYQTRMCVRETYLLHPALHSFRTTCIYFHSELHVCRTHFMHPHP